MTDGKELAALSKAYFAQITKTDQLISRLLASSRRLRESLMGKAVSYDERVSGGAPEGMDGRMSAVLDYEAEADEQIRDLTARKREALELIGKLEDYDQRAVLIARYIDGLSWPDIADQMHYSESWVYALHGKGLVSFAECNLAKA